MADFKFIQENISGHWTIISPRRSKRPNISKGTQAQVCPFCNPSKDEEIFRLDTKNKDNWDVLVVKNKFPFAPNHEIIIHSPDHHKTFDELPFNQVEKVIKIFRERFNKHKSSGQVYIFTNSGEDAGESILHPHSQLVVIPENVRLEIPSIPKEIGEAVETNFFQISCPPTSSWPDEVWIIPKRRKISFGEIFEEEIIDLSNVLQRLIQIMDIRHEKEFPYNLYFAPFEDWYLRLIPRRKILGGFEVGTNVYVNSQDPSDTLRFIKNYFNSPAGKQDDELIRKEYLAEYERKV